MWNIIIGFINYNVFGQAHHNTNAFMNAKKNLGEIVQEALNKFVHEPLEEFVDKKLE